LVFKRIYLLISIYSKAMNEESSRHVLYREEKPVAGSFFNGQTGEVPSGAAS